MSERDLREYTPREPWKAIVYKRPGEPLSLLLWATDKQTGTPVHAQGLEAGDISMEHTCWFLACAPDGQAEFLRGGDVDCDRSEAEELIRESIPDVEFGPEGGWSF